MSKAPKSVGYKLKLIFYKDIKPQVPLTSVRIIHGKHTKKNKRFKPLHVLVDSGTSASIICKQQLHGNKSYHSNQKNGKPL